MNEQMTVNSDEDKTVSKLSKIGFFTLIGAYIILALGITFNINVLSIIAPGILFLSVLASAIIAILDLRKKDRKKWLSITTIVLDGLYILLFGVVIIVFAILQ